MATWTHRTTKEFIRSKSPAQMLGRFGTLTVLIQDSPEANALFAAGVPTKYWDIVGDLVTEMSAAEKAAVDAELLTARNNEQRAAAKSLIVSGTPDTSERRKEKAILVMLIREFNILRGLHGLPDRTLEQFKDRFDLDVDAD